VQAAAAPLAGATAAKKFADVSSDFASISKVPAAGWEQDLATWPLRYLTGPVPGHCGRQGRLRFKVWTSAGTCPQGQVQRWTEREVMRRLPGPLARSFRRCRTTWPPSPRGRPRAGGLSDLLQKIRTRSTRPRRRSSSTRASPPCRRRRPPSQARLRQRSLRTCRATWPPSPRCRPRAGSRRLKFTGRNTELVCTASAPGTFASIGVGADTAAVSSAAGWTRVHAESSTRTDAQVHGPHHIAPMHGLRPRHVGQQSRYQHHRRRQAQRRVGRKPMRRCVPP
jgi:hypothetical protein